MIFASGTQFHYVKAIVAPFNQVKAMEGPSMMAFSFSFSKVSFKL